jgi:hypothetical protein
MIKALSAFKIIKKTVDVFTILSYKQYMSNTVERVVHFVGFRDDRFWNAVKVFGRPHFIHRGWDLRARREIDLENDLVVFADGEFDQEPRRKSFDDIRERYLI